MLTFDQILERLESEATAWVRAAAVRPTPEEPWKLKLLEVVTGEAPPAWEARNWRYPLALFATYRQSGAQAAGMLRTRSVSVCGIDVSVADTVQVASVERRETGAQTYFQTLDWPTLEIKLAIFGPDQVNDPPGSLISDQDDPSFLTFYDATTSFFQQRRQQTGGTVNQDGVYRHQDRSARFNSARMLVAEDALELAVEGDHLDGLVAELAGHEPGPTQALNGLDRRLGRRTPHLIRFELSGGLPPGSWVLLRRGSEWIDRRFLTYAYTRQTEAGIEIVVDQATRLEALVGDWERVGVEFKRQMPSGKESRLKIMKTVCAFANGSGGSLLLGVDDEDRSYVGVDTRALDGLQRQLDQMVRSWVDPYPVTHFESSRSPTATRSSSNSSSKPARLSTYAANQARPAGLTSGTIRALRWRQEPRFWRSPSEAPRMFPQDGNLGNRN